MASAKWRGRGAQDMRNGLLGVCLRAELNTTWFVDRRYFLRAFPVARVSRCTCMPASCSLEKHERVAPTVHDYSVV